MMRLDLLVPLLVSAVLAVFAIIFSLRLEIADDVWPVEGTGPLSFTLIGSFFASACAATLWCLWERQPGALFGLGLDYLTIFGLLAVLAFTLSDGSSVFVVVAAALIIGAVLVASALLPAIRSPITDQRPQPRLVRWSFYGSVLWLVAVGIALVLEVRDVLPWPVPGKFSVIAGCLFLGAGAFLGYSVLRPSWANAGGQLAAFLAYDVVLLYPLLALFSEVDADLRINLIVYTWVVIYSALLAAFYLFVNRQTRVSLSQ